MSLQNNPIVFLLILSAITTMVLGQSTTGSSNPISSSTISMCRNATDRRAPLHPNVAIAYRNMVKMGHRVARRFGMHLPPMATTGFTGNYTIMNGTLNRVSETFARMRAQVGVYYQKSMFPATNQNRNLSVLFLGDSLTKYFTSIGGAAWDRHYKPRGSLNLGIGILSSGQMVKLIERGLFDGLNPKVVVLFIGPTDLLMRVATGEQIAENVRIATKLIREKLPQAKIILMGLLPAEVPMETLMEGDVANKIIAKFDDGENVFYLGLSSLFGNERGEIFPDLYFFDNLHIGTCGYEVWAREMEPLMRRLLNDST